MVNLPKLPPQFGNQESGPFASQSPQNGSTNPFSQGGASPFSQPSQSAQSQQPFRSFQGTRGPFSGQVDPAVYSKPTASTVPAVQPTTPQYQVEPSVPTDPDRTSSNGIDIAGIVLALVTLIAGGLMLLRVKRGFPSIFRGFDPLRTDIYQLVADSFGIVVFIGVAGIVAFICAIIMISRKRSRILGLIALPIVLGACLYAPWAMFQSGVHAAQLATQSTMVSVINAIDLDNIDIADIEGLETTISEIATNLGVDTDEIVDMIPTDAWNKLPEGVRDEVSSRLGL